MKSRSRPSHDDKPVPGDGSLAKRISNVRIPASDKAAQQRIDDWLAEIGDQNAKKALAGILQQNSNVHALIAGLSGYSPYLWGLASSEPDRLLRLLQSAPDEHFRSLLDWTAAAISATTSETEVMRLLRRMKSEAALLIALADIGNVWPLEHVTHLLTELADASLASAVRFLLGQGAKLIAIPCNTASAAALHSLRALHPDVPFVGMEPAVKPAAEHTTSGVVGVLATPTTFEGELYASVVERFGQGVTILQSACPGLVGEIEAGRANGAQAQRILRDICKWHAQEFAYLLGRLKSIREGDGNMLDHTCLLYIHEHAEANIHKNNGLVAIVAGHLNKMVTGTHSQVTGSMGDLYRAVAGDVLKVELDDFPTSSRKLEGLV